MQWSTVFTVSAAVFWRLLKPMKALESMNSSMWMVLTLCGSCSNVSGRGEINNCFIEVSSCVGGCINGPLAGGRESDRFKARIYTNQKIIREFPKDIPEMEEKVLLRKEFTESSRKAVIPDGGGDSGSPSAGWKGIP